MEKLLLTEVNRLREIMGLQILKEDRSDIIVWAEKAFARSAKSVEQDFLSKLKGAADDTDFYRVLKDAAYAAETKILMKEVILGSNQKLFSQMESMILGLKNNSVVDAKIKRWIDKTIDNKLSGASNDVKDLYKTQYKSYVDDLTAGANSKDVFGRDITPYVKKTKTTGTVSTDFRPNEALKELEAYPSYRGSSTEAKEFVKNQLEKLKYTPTGTELQKFLQKELKNFLDELQLAGEIKAGEKALREKKIGNFSKKAGIVIDFVTSQKARGRYKNIAITGAVAALIYLAYLYGSGAFDKAKKFKEEIFPDDGTPETREIRKKFKEIDGGGENSGSSGGDSGNSSGGDSSGGQ
jgi:hypothetical protein